MKGRVTVERAATAAARRSEPSGPREKAVTGSGGEEAKDGERKDSGAVRRREEGEPATRAAGGGTWAGTGR